MTGQAIQSGIYDDPRYHVDNNWIWKPIFRQYFMPSEFTGNRMEEKIAFPTYTLCLLVNQLSMGMRIRVSGILAYLISQYTVYRSKEKNQEQIKDMVGEENHESTRKGTHKTDQEKQKLSVRD